MTEEKKPEEKIEEKPEEKVRDKIEEAKDAAKEMREANIEKKNLLDREEKILADKIAGGVTEAGIEAPKQSEDEIKKQGAKEFFKGTALESAIDKYE